MRPQIEAKGLEASRDQRSARLERKAYHHIR